MNLGVIAIKTLELEPGYQMLFSYIPKTLFFFHGDLTSLQGMESVF